MNEFALLQAMEGIGAKQVQEAGSLLGYTGQKSRRGRRKLWRTLLLAAVIASLLGVTAYAAGWFGLSSRVQPAPPLISFTPNPKDPISELPREPGGLISANGYANSPAALAHKEWHEFWVSYTDSHPEIFEGEDWLPEDEELKPYAVLYAAFDQTMLDKLLEIQDSYSIKLHSQKKLMPNSSMFYRVTGTGEFVLSDDIDMKGAAHYVYEDGSFYIQARAMIDGQDCFVDLSRGTKNVLDPMLSYVYDLEKYQESLYTTGKGVEVNLASNGKSSFVFYDSGDYIVTVHADCGNAQALAQMFDFEAMCQGETDLGLLNTEPVIAQKKEGLLTMEEFMETPEYQASTRFQEVTTDVAHEERIAKRPDIPFGRFPSFYYGYFPTGKEVLDQTLEELLAVYPLTLPREDVSIQHDKHVPVEYIEDIGVYNRDLRELELEEAMQEDYCKLMGTGHFLTSEDAYFIAATSWDNGCWQAGIFMGHSSFELAYIPKGCFYPLLVAPKAEGSGYAYDSACGEQVYIYSYAATGYPTYNAYILYETKSAYVVATVLTGMPDLSYTQNAADMIDFTMFK